MLRITIIVILGGMLSAYEPLALSCARSAALCNAVSAAAANDLNSASIATFRGVEARAIYCSPYTEPEINQYGMNTMWGTPWSSFAAEYSAFALSYFREDNVRLTHAISLNNVFSAGYSVDYRSIVIDDLSRYTLAADIGLQWRIFPPLTVGVGVNELSFAGDMLYAADLAVHAGIAYEIMSNFTVLATAFYREGFYAASGFELTLFDIIAIRAGASTVGILSGGIGAMFANFGLDYAAVFHPDLGITHVVSVHYRIIADNDITPPVRNSP